MIHEASKTIHAILCQISHIAPCLNWFVNLLKYVWKSLNISLKSVQLSRSSFRTCKYIEAIQFKLLPGSLIVKYDSLVWSLSMQDGISLSITNLWLHLLGLFEEIYFFSAFVWFKFAFQILLGVRYCSSIDFRLRPLLIFEPFVHLNPTLRFNKLWN